MCDNEKSLRKACIGLHVSNFKIINQNLVAIMKKPNSIEMKKPLAVGFAILELSKLFMCQSYDKFKEHFGPKNLKLCFSDTDSFLFSVKCNNLIEKLKSIEHMFDFSKYKNDHELYDNSRANQIELSAMPSKRYVLPCGKCKLALGSSQNKKCNLHPCKKIQ